MTENKKTAEEKWTAHQRHILPLLTRTAPHGVKPDVDMQVGGSLSLLEVPVYI